VQCFIALFYYLRDSNLLFLQIK